MTATATARTASLEEVARQMTAGGRGILAADESIRTMSQRLEAAGVTPSETARRDYRQLLLTTPGLAEHVSGIILCDETFNQVLTDGRTFPEAARQLGILPGIKVDTGTVPLPGAADALVTEGLDGLGDRLQKYAEQGAAFAKWRAVVGATTVTDWSARVNAQALARYAGLCQQHGIVPIVEPEVLAAGDHDLVASAQATRTILLAVFQELEDAGVDLHGIVLKPNFVTSGLGCQKVSIATVATVTNDVLRECVPAAVPGIAFLSGGHCTSDVCGYLRQLNQIDGTPWHLTFSFGRALVNDALATWGGSPANVTQAQRALLGNCREAADATR